MPCEQIQTQLPALLDGELTPEAAAVVDAHLTTCDRCAAARDEIQGVLALTSAWSVEGGEIQAAVQQQILQEEMHALLQEMQRLRGEVVALRSEVAELKSREARRVPAPPQASSVLRFPYATVRDTPRPVL